MVLDCYVVIFSDGNGGFPNGLRVCVFPVLNSEQAKEIERSLNNLFPSSNGLTIHLRLEKAEHSVSCRMVPKEAARAIQRWGNDYPIQEIIDECNEIKDAIDKSWTAEESDVIQQVLPEKEEQFPEFAPGEPIFHNGKPLKFEGYRVLGEFKEELPGWDICDVDYFQLIWKGDLYLQLSRRLYSEAEHLGDWTVKKIDRAELVSIVVAKGLDYPSEFETDVQEFFADPSELFEEKLSERWVKTDCGKVMRIDSFETIGKYNSADSDELSEFEFCKNELMRDGDNWLLVYSFHSWTGEFTRDECKLIPKEVALKIIVENEFRIPADLKKELIASPATLAMQRLDKIDETPSRLKTIDIPDRVDDILNWPDEDTEKAESKVERKQSEVQNPKPEIWVGVLDDGTPIEFDEDSYDTIFVFSKGELFFGKERAWWSLNLRDHLAKPFTEQEAIDLLAKEPVGVPNSIFNEVLDASKPIAANEIVEAIRYLTLPEGRRFEANRFRSIANRLLDCLEGEQFRDWLLKQENDTQFKMLDFIGRLEVYETLCACTKSMWGPELSGGEIFASWLELKLKNSPIENTKIETANRRHADRLSDLKVLNLAYKSGNAVDANKEKAAKNWLGRDWNSKLKNGLAWWETFDEETIAELKQIKVDIEQFWKDKAAQKAAQKSAQK